MLSHPAAEALFEVTPDGTAMSDGSDVAELSALTQCVRTPAPCDQVIADSDDFSRDRIWFRLWSRCGLPAPYAGLHDRAKRG